MGSYPDGKSDFGIADLAGNGWEWTRTPFEPFSGLSFVFLLSRIFRGFFSTGRHFVMEGWIAAHGSL